jgi:propanol-preferring alcohol dehydrogenase
MNTSYPAMRLEQVGQALRPVSLALRAPGEGEVRIRVAACAVCRTDLHLVDGELAQAAIPVVPGHEIVGHVEAVGRGVTRVKEGDRVGVPWLGWTCGTCAYCRSGQENLCRAARFTGCHIDGGFAGVTYAQAAYVFALPASYADAAAAPLLCAGLIGWRALKAAGDAKRVGLYGFGAAAHILVQVARARGQDIYAFVRPGDDKAREFAREMGALWAGDSTEAAPEELDAAIIFAPVGDVVPAALRAVRPGGRVICGGIHMSDIPSFPYRLLWEERSIRSIANLTRQDGEEFMELAASVAIRTEITRYGLSQANAALNDLRTSRLNGAAVLVPDDGAR